jgi:NAD-dependent dihydropyrimidine dehydrogenase PreA subunit
MIELVSQERCIKCDVCIRVCPTNVFEHGPDRLPVIKRQADCQTCFMCEAWCPTDALFVAPQTDPVPLDSPYRDETWLIERGLLGSYRRELGWSDELPLAGPRRSTQHVMARELLPVGGEIEGGET